MTKVVSESLCTKSSINMGRNVNIHFFKLLMQMELVEH